MPLEIVRNDITNMRVDAVVNAANSGLQRGGGVCGAIFAAAGAAELERECAEIGGCATGSAVLTGGGKLPAKFIIHTVGPVWQGGQNGEEEKLRACYRNSLELAVSRGFESVAFPLISSGIYGYPKDQALNVAVSEIGSFLLEHDIDVFLVVFDRDSYRLSEARQRSIQAFIDDAYAKAREWDRSNRMAELALQLSQERETSTRPQAKAAPCASPKAAPFFKPKASRKPEPEELEEEAVDAAPHPAPSALERFIERAGESFTQALLRLIDERGLTDPQVYQRANLDRRLFSKIRGNPQYRPSKNTALALAVALRLNLDQTQDLLRRAGYALSPSSRFDLIVEYFIREENYNIFEINEALFAFEESLLGA
ncbi:MAG: macro domain-containing protein [Clostridiaceae bacterium]